MDLLSVYDDMVKEAGDVQEVEQEQEVVNSRMEVLAKYAELSTNLLAEEYGDGNFSEEDVTKLSSLLIDEDIAREEAQEKVAEYVQAGQIMARAFQAELAATATEGN